MNFEVLVTRLMMDKDFNARFHADKSAALKEIGINPTQAVLSALNAVNYKDIEAAWAALPHALKPLN
jgi:hypothetical protein